MAKRAKAKKADEPAKARPKTPEPFYRPFSKIAPARRKKGEEPAPEAAPKPAPKARPKVEEPAPQPMDSHTFALYMAGVRPLDERATRIPHTASRVERAARPTGPVEDPDAAARDRMRSLVVEGIRFETMDDGDRLEGRRIDVDPRDLRRLRRGQFAVDGKLDLHGLGLEEARQAVEAFVKKRAADGDRAVVIVHGKGTHSPRGQAVLRGEIAAWLSQGRAARYIAAFATAPDEQGGTGAVLVLLAR